MSLDLTKAREIFEESTDFTVGLEEEFQLIDPESLELTQRYTELSDAAQADGELAASIAGELITSEIEIRSGRGENFPLAVALQQANREKLFALAAQLGLRLGSLGTHPWSRWQDQQIIDTEHYRLVRDGLQYVAWRNNTFSLHVHVGVRGADRAIAVCDRLRELLPQLLALSASSPFVEDRDSGLASARTQVFTRMFPRCGVPDHFGDWQTYAEFIEFLKSTNSVVESTQLWWSVRPHHSFGTVEVRICDAQPNGDDSTALSGLIVACIAQAARDVDEGRPFEPLAGRYIEENLWRAIRHGLDGRMIDFASGDEYPSAEIGDRLLAWTEPVRSELGIEPKLPEVGACQRLRGGDGDLRERFEVSLKETASTYAPTPAVARLQS